MKQIWNVVRLVLIAVCVIILTPPYPDIELLVVPVVAGLFNLKLSHAFVATYGLALISLYFLSRRQFVSLVSKIRSFLKL